MRAELTPYCLSIAELILAYWRHVESYYVKDGRATCEQDNIRQALRFVRKLYGPTQARDFGPIALKLVRQSMIETRRCRTLINKDVHRIRAMFRWGAAEELYPGSKLPALSAVTALQKGRSEAKEKPPIRPVDEAVVLATLPHLSPQVASMVRFQLLTAARPGEDTIFAGHHQPLRTGVLCLDFMGLNLSHEPIAQDLGIDPDDAQVMASQLREGIVGRKPEVKLNGEVECDEVDVVAGHKGHPAALRKKGDPAVADGGRAPRAG